MLFDTLHPLLCHGPDANMGDRREFPISGLQEDIEYRNAKFYTVYRPTEFIEV